MMTPRVTTGITDLDQMIEGGFPRGSAIHVRGAPGTGKTTLALQFLLEGAQQEEAGLFVTFEAFPEALYRDASSLGLDLRSAEATGALSIVFTSPHVFLESLRDPQSPLSLTLRERNVRRVAIDSATHFRRLTDDEQVLRRIYATLINSLKRDDITTILLSEEFSSRRSHTAPGGLSYLCDGIILLRYVEIDSAIKRALVVLKMRGSSHARDIRHYTIQAGGLTIGRTFEHRGAILSGISRRDR